MSTRLRRIFGTLGPGLITGAADNDPAGIATYTQIGAQYGYAQAWTALFALPLLTAVQEACARIGLVTGKGLARVMRERYSRTVLFAAVGILLVANTINIGADIGAMAAAAQLVVPVPFVVLVLAAVCTTLLLEIFTPYRVYARYLKWLSLASLTYVLTALLVHEPWGEVLRATVLPHVQWNASFLFLMTGNIGTTIAPYLFFWEASQEVEEDREHRRIERDGAVRMSPTLVARMRIDNASGMLFSQLITWSIIVASATVLNGGGVTDVRTAAGAAVTLEPLVRALNLSDHLAQVVFALGIVSSGLLVIPILSTSAAYALSDAGNWMGGLNLKLRRAHGFYGVITVATLIGLAIDFAGLNLIKLLIYASVLNGIAAIPLLFLIGRIAGNRDIMGTYASGRLSKVCVFAALLVMAALAGGMLVLL